MSLQWLNPLPRYDQQPSLLPESSQLTSLLLTSSQPSFANPDDLAFCQALSQQLLRHPEARQFPDVIALGFWLRSAQLTAMLQPYQALYAAQHIQLQPTGLWFHSAPRNVDSLFMYAAILSLLCGNQNIIRLSSARGGSSALVLTALQQLAAAYPNQCARLQLVACPHQDAELAALVARVDGRVLWGSDDAILAQRQLPMPAHARELCFHHKLSLCVLNAAYVMEQFSGTDASANTQQMLALFVRDHLTFAQQACSSAKVVVWQGSAAECYSAQQLFWPALCDYVAQHPVASLQETEHFQAMAAAQYFAMQGYAQGHAADPHQPSITQPERMSLANAAPPALQWTAPFARLQIPHLREAITLDHPGCGLFIELTVARLDDLTSQLTQAHQTISYVGYTAAQCAAWLAQCPRGVERMVPLGESLQFGPIWDGMDLVLQFSRLRVIR